MAAFGTKNTGAYVSSQRHMTLVCQLAAAKGILRPCARLRVTSCKRWEEHKEQGMGNEGKHSLAVGIGQASAKAHLPLLTSQFLQHFMQISALPISCSSRSETLSPVQT